MYSYISKNTPTSRSTHNYYHHYLLCSSPYMAGNRLNGFISSILNQCCHYKYLYKYKCMHVCKCILTHEYVVVVRVPFRCFSQMVLTQRLAGNMINIAYLKLYVCYKLACYICYLTHKALI